MANKSIYDENTIQSHTGDSIVVDITVADRLGLDGASVENAEITTSGDLRMQLSDGRIINAGRAIGRTHLCGLADTATEPAASEEIQTYITTGSGTYENFTNRNGDAITISDPNTITILFRTPNRTWWESQELKLDMSGYRKISAPITFSSSLPELNYYPYSLDPADNYDKITGMYTLPEGCKSITSPSEVFGEVIYKDCTHILLGFTLARMTYFEVRTGKRFILYNDSKATDYGSPISSTGTEAPFIKVFNYDVSSSKIDIYHSFDGNAYTLLATVDVGSPDSEEYILFRSIGYYEPDGTGLSKIIYTGGGDRLMLDNIPAIDVPAYDEDMEVLVPADNYAGITKRVIHIPKARSRFADKKILIYGDSITAEFGVEYNTYKNILIEKFESENILLHGYPGYEISGTGTQGESLTQDELLDKIVAEEPYLAVIFGGTNDYWHNTIPGIAAAGNTIEYTTAGGLRYILNYLNNRLHGKTNLMVCTPPPGFYSDHVDSEMNDRGCTMDDYVSVIKKTAEFFHTPVCDIRGNANWQADMEYNEKLFTTDGLHLSETGYRRIAELQYSCAERRIF
ncbi:MAG: SGNH/GDSL hydrolase family protein [Rikenellaceae bacterium]|nr:SGNH/GDSL hydrolase family protein [Rikenellaceae bacterium]